MVLPGGAATWTVLGPDHGVVGPAEEFLEYLRVQGTSPNTVKSYARALALWWTYLAVFGLAWDALTLADVGGFLAWLRSGDGPQVITIEPRPARFAESTISTRLRAVTSCYRFHELNGVALGGDLVRVVHGGRAVYKPMLEHVARKRGRQRPVIRVRASRHVPPPVLSPGQIEAICDACARFDAASGQWTGQVRDRLLWSLLAETGLRLGEALGLQHRDWHTGRGDTPFIEVVPREHPHGVRVKGGDLPAGVHLRRAGPALRGVPVAAVRGGRRPGGAGPGRRAGLREPGGRHPVRAVAARKASMTWSGGCAGTWPGRSRRPGPRTG